MNNETFNKAVSDYFFLLNQGYQPGQILKLVGDHHQLSSVQRTMLYRGIFLNFEICKREEKLIRNSADLAHSQVYVDGLNVLITVASYLQGVPVFIANDSILRDAAQLRGKIQQLTRVETACDLMLKMLISIRPATSIIFIDKEFTFHDKIISGFLKSQWWDNDRIRLEVVDKVDKILISKENGIVCTSDTGIIDRTSGKIFDLPAQIIKETFSPDFFNLSDHNF